MKAVIFYKHGGLENLEYTTVPKPRISSDEVLVETKACALNHLDIWVRQGLPGIKIPLPHILGCESTGYVRQLGQDVIGIGKGERVLIAPGISCGRCEYCLAGRDSLCDEFKIMGYQIDGGYAEYVKAPAKNIIPISNKLSFEEWASIPLVFLTAWHMLITKGELKPGQTVLIQAAGSGIGSAAIQIARLCSASVITTVGSDEKLKKAKLLGADKVINYNKKDFAKEVKRLTDGKGVDLVFEHIGPQTWEKSLASLKKGGRMVTCGATSGPIASIDIRFLFVKELSLFGCYMGARRELLDVLRLVEEGRLRPVIDSVYPLKDAAKAQARMLDRKNFGKIVLKI